MKFLLGLILILSGTKAFALEWEAGVRENFITAQSYNYNSDSSSRIRRELFDRGYNRLAIHPRLAWAGNDKSIIFFPPIKSSLEDLGVMNTRVSQGNGELTLKPLIYSSPGLGEAQVIENISPQNASLTLVTYGQALSLYTSLARKNGINRLVVGSGLVHLLSDKGLIPKFEQMLKNARKGLTNTELILEVVGKDDLSILASALKNGFDLDHLVDGLSIVLEPTVHFPKGQVDVSAIKETRLALEILLPGMPLHLSRVVIPSCLRPFEVGYEWYCNASDRDPKLQLSRFKEFKNLLLELEDSNLGFETVEIMESNTDFEPSNPDPRYPYYNTLFSNPQIYELPSKPLVIAPAIPLPQSRASKTACIYYDKKDEGPKIDRIGDIHSVMLESVLGAFPSYKVKRLPLSRYSKGDASDCSALFYLATNFSQVLPDNFLSDLANFSKKNPVFWFNYKFSEFAQYLISKQTDPGFDAAQLLQPDSIPSETNTDPGFFRHFDYKGEIFSKLAVWNPASQNFSASPELHLITVKNPADVKILATSRHSKSNQSIPYVVNNNHIWYMADSPFSFVHPEDRFYIFCDLLWDVLNETPPDERIALVRIEDVGPQLNMVSLRWAMDYLFSKGVPFSLGVIPYFSDIIGSGGPDYLPTFKPITKYPSFVAQLKYAVSRDASIIMHGTAHSVGSLISGYDGVSGGDYEFWLYPENTPLPFDSVEWTTRRLEMGINIFRELDITPSAFEVPHYAASVLNYMIFGKLFRWNYHRSIYFPFSVEQDTALPENYNGFDCDPNECGDERRAILNNIKVDADYTTFGGMTLPFITYRDAYGQAVIPETLGMIDFAFYASDTWRPVSKPEDILRRAKKLKVIRGAVASFFWHPQLLNERSRYYQEDPGSYERIGGKKSLSIVVNGLKDLGYKFISIDNKHYFPETMP